MLALAFFACSCAAAAATLPLGGALPRPDVSLRRAGAMGAVAVPLRLKGGGRLNLGKEDKSDQQMADDAALR